MPATVAGVCCGWMVGCGAEVSVIVYSLEIGHAVHPAPGGRRMAVIPNKLVSAANGIDYACREVGEGTVPLVLLQHLRPR
jgi:hypothetical protein